MGSLPSPKEDIKVGGADRRGPEEWINELQRINIVHKCTKLSYTREMNELEDTVLSEISHKRRYHLLLSTGGT